MTTEEMYDKIKQLYFYQTLAQGSSVSKITTSFLDSINVVDIFIFL
jgi:hypothetical protein